MSSKWNEYGSFEQWMNGYNNIDLRSDYEADWYERGRMYDPPSFEDWCLGKWQRMS